MMNQWTSSINRSQVVFALTITVSIYWFLSLLINVYRLPFIGAIYELLWIGMLPGLFGLPVFSFISWAKNKFSLRSLYFYSFIISLISILLIVTSK
ncbi:MAG TPA: hypothetical protein VKB95_03745, partial [Chitinophagaceae bacterium]|nr:hypothetical protein [Chitinophagaceae bacterium]